MCEVTGLDDKVNDACPSILVCPILTLFLPTKLSASSGNVTAHRSVQDGVDVSAACQSHLHHLVEVVQVEPVGHFKQDNLTALGVGRHCQLWTSSGCLET